MRLFKNSFFKVVFFVVAVSVAGYVEGQETLWKSFEIRTENTRPRITKLYRDKTGLIYAATDHGIFTYDGSQFKKINGSDSVNSVTTAIFQDHNSIIWAAYENGKIIRIKNGERVEFNPQEGFPKVPVSAISEDNEGRIYFATKGEGIYCLDNNHIFNINSDDGLSDNYCYTMIKYSGLVMCAGTDAGINFISFENGKKNIKSLGTADSLPDDIVRSLALDNHNNLWLGLQDKGIAFYNSIKKRFETVLKDSIWKYGQINCLLPVDDELWIATDKDGIFILENNILRPFKINDEIIKSVSIIPDLENNIWIAESNHLIRTSGNKLLFISDIGKKKLSFIHCITSDKKGNIWFSPDEQLGTIYKSDKGELLYKEYKVINEKVDIVALYFDPYGFLWMGTLGDGVYRFNPQTGRARKITDEKETESSSVLSINGRGNEVWVAGFNSVIKYTITKNGNDENSTVTRDQPFVNNRISTDYVYCIFIDSKNRIWFGTDESGIYYFENGSLINIPVPESPVHGFTEDTDGRIWFTTSEAGLQFIDTDKSIKYYKTNDGLSDLSPTSVISSPDGKLIVVQSNGLDVIDYGSHSIIYHSSEENVADLNGDLNSVVLTGDSTIWIGTERGILRYKPYRDMQLKSPDISIENVSLFLNRIDYRNKNEFDSDENNFRFDYSALWYGDPQRINFLYMLEGYSNKWISTKDHNVTFPQLPPGKYSFHVKVSLNNNFSNSSEAIYDFKINTPVWQRWWFRIITAGIIALFIFLIIKRRESRLRKVDLLEKENLEFQFETLKSQVNPHFLFNSFNTLINVIEENPALAVEYVEKLSEFFRNIVKYKDINVITIEEELNILNSYIFIQQKRYGNNLRLEVLIDRDIQRSKCVPPLTLQLLSENAIKHNSVSKESHLIITINTEDNFLIVRNNINPKIMPEPSSGFGLPNIVNRYELLTKERVKIYSDGTDFIVSLPLLKH